MKGAPSLLDSATKACMKAAPVLDDVGDFEYWKIRRILLQVKSAEQLHKIEINSPQIAGEDAEIWQAILAREFPSWRAQNVVPKDPTKWYKVYKKFQREQKLEVERDREALKNAMMAMKKDKESHLSKVVDLRALPKIPRDPRMMAHNGGVPLKGNKFGKAAPTSLVFSGGSKTKITDGASVLTKARREAREIGHRSKLSTPAHLLQGRTGQVKRAPEAMLNATRIAAQPALKILTKHRSLGSPGISGPSLEDREKRLRAAQAGVKRNNTVIKETQVEFSDDDSLDDDDLFDEQRKSSPISRQSPPRKIIAPVGPSVRRQAPSSSPPENLAMKLSKDVFGRVSKNASPSEASSARSSPAGSRPATPKPMMASRKRPEVDVFNRGPKRPRMR